MTKVPANLANNGLAQYLKACGLQLVHRGKVRDTYMIDDYRLLVVATNRISIFDFVLNAEIPRKGEVLTALTHFWPTQILKGFDNHLISANGSPEKNAIIELMKDVQRLPVEQCLVVQNFQDQIYPFEMIYRHHIGGSIYKKYAATGFAAGIQLMPGLPKWSRLQTPLFTPSTKEEIGHDINVDAAYFFNEMAKNNSEVEVEKSVNTLSKAYAKAYAYAEERGILILDTKFECAGKTIIDEILTPDSCRFALKTDWEKAMNEGRDPYFHDKQPVRDWGSKIKTPFKDDEGHNILGINHLNPEIPEHVKFVHSLKVPEKIISDTTNRYLGIFKMITGKTLDEYQAEFFTATVAV